MIGDIKPKVATFKLSNKIKINNFIFILREQIQRILNKFSPCLLFVLFQFYLILTT